MNGTREKEAGEEGEEEKGRERERGSSGNVDTRIVCVRERGKRK